MLLNLLIFSVSVSIQWVSCHPNPHIVIVGSGAAGVAAATRLLKNNFTNITILEAESRIGGRIHSVKFGEAYVDLGANFCHGEKNNIVYSLTKDLGVLKNFPTEYRFLRSNGEILDKATASKVIKFEESVAFLEKHEKCKNLSSVGECLKIKSGDFIKSAENPKETEIFSEAYDWVESSVCSLNAAFDLNDLNITSAFQDSEGDQNLKWKGHGYKTILDIMMEKFPNAENPLPIDEKIFLDKEVTNITNWREDTATVLTNDGDKYEADHVIFTPSLGVLKASHKNLFEPDLPEDKVKAINGIGFGAIVTIIMHFPVKWWDGPADFPVMWTTEHKEKLKEENLEWLSTMTGTVQAENNTHVILSWYGGKYVPHIETLSEEEVRKGLIHLLNLFFSPRFNVTMPDKIISQIVLCYNQISSFLLELPSSGFAARTEQLFELPTLASRIC
ncbi:spermine oxidase-like isoform X2 [Sitophilus oryzae]|uniref:Spermine oxidase-like isoform X2 n=1 Tax=Sitophilus oryzae TaxID=7048 RepID=A0A6J2YSR8_SITOR|nr:spermine oxidase-like isoform X2 [Sitophilus oryzae]